MNLMFNTTPSPGGLAHSQGAETQKKYAKIRAEASNARIENAMTSSLKKNFINASLEKDIIKYIHSATSLKIFFDIEYDQKILQKDYLIKSVDNSKLEIKDLSSMFKSILNELEESLKEESGTNLDISYTMFIKYDYPEISFKRLSASICDSLLQEAFSSLPQNKIKVNMEHYLHLNKRKIEPQINEHFEFI